MLLAPKSSVFCWAINQHNGASSFLFILFVITKVQGLQLNCSKCELVILGHQTTTEVTITTDLYQEILPDTKILTDTQILLLQASVSEASIKPTIEAKVKNLRLEPHHGQTLLKNYFSIRLGPDEVPGRWAFLSSGEEKIYFFQKNLSILKFPP